MATYTSNYQLHQWEPRDAFLRTDFNSDFQKIDQSLAQVRALAGEKCSAVAGSYTRRGHTGDTAGFSSIGGIAGDQLW